MRLFQKQVIVIFLFLMVVGLPRLDLLPRDQSQPKESTEGIPPFAPFLDITKNSDRKTQRSNIDPTPKRER